MNKIVKTRGIKFLSLDTKKIEEEINIITRVCNDFSKQIRKDMKSGHITKVTSFGFKDSDKNTITFKEYRDKHKHIFNSIGWTKPLNGYERDLVGYVGRRYKGFFKRNRTKKMPTIKFSQKGIHVKDRFVKVKDDHILFPCHNQEKGSQPELKVPFGKCTNFNSLNELDLKKGVGGNLSLEQKFFMCTTVNEVDPLYKFESTISFDINKDKDYWISFEDGEIVCMPDDVADELENLRLLNEILTNKKRHESLLKSSQRRHYRRRWRNKHKKVEKMIEPYVMKIVDKAIENKSLVCIDNVSTGHKNGSFGQDKIISILQKKCEDLNIPFYGVPTFFTSQMCNNCGHCDEGNRDGNDFECLSCAHTDVSHLNAAKNIRDRALLFYENKVPFSMYKDSEENVLKKYGS
tara:strand:+ start:1490 stop:2704 length:1215 start_codon:yes stop_codon:yes gene_type:complete